MTAKEHVLIQFRQVLENAINLVGDRFRTNNAPNGDTKHLTSLLSQCEALVQRLDARPAPSIRIIHHFACTGGTLMSKCIASSPNTVLFSEIDPLSTHHFTKPQRPFWPTDLLADLHYSPRPTSDQVKIDQFTAGLKSLYRNLNALGQHVVLRDHAHSHYCIGATVPIRPGLTDMVRTIAHIRAILTVRHPRDSFASLRANKFIHFTPMTLTEYCRRYDLFLDAHADIPQFRYEDFLKEPDKILRLILAALDLRPTDDFSLIASLFRLSGDSGRGGDVIAPRPTRQALPDLLQANENPEPYVALCRRLHYSP